MHWFSQNSHRFKSITFISPQSIRQAVCKLELEIHLCPHIKYGLHYTNFHKHSCSVTLCGDLPYQILHKSVISFVTSSKVWPTQPSYTRLTTWQLVCGISIPNFMKIWLSLEPDNRLWMGLVPDMAFIICFIKNAWKVVNHILQRMLPPWLAYSLSVIVKYCECCLSYCVS